MAITPNEAVEILNNEEQSLVERLEELIDANIIERKQSVANFEPIIIKIGNNIPESIRDIIVKKYRGQHWDVKIIDARGGKCFKFMPKIKTKSIFSIFNEIIKKVK